MKLPELLESRLAEIRRGEDTHPVAKYVGNAPKATDGQVDLRSNDYLCLASAPDIILAELRVLVDVGHGEMRSRPFASDADHRKFETFLAKLLGAEAGLLFPSGFAANAGLLRALVKDEDPRPVYLDKRVHMSFLEGLPWLFKRGGLRRREPNLVYFEHNDPDSLRAELSGRDRKPGYVVIDALYSTDGRLAPLRDFAQVVEEYDCVLIVDETHSFGTQGPGGRGLVVEHGLEDKVHFRTIGLSKAVPCRGGIVIGPERVLNTLRYEAFSLIFSSTILPHEVAGYSAAVNLIVNAEEKRERLHRSHERLRDGLQDLGFDVASGTSQIVGLPTEDLVAARAQLEGHGIYGSAFCPPATPDKEMIIRFSVNSGHSSEEIDTVLAVCSSLPRVPRRKRSGSKPAGGQR